MPFNDAVAFAVTIAVTVTVSDSGGTIAQHSIQFVIIIASSATFHPLAAAFPLGVARDF